MSDDYKYYCSHCRLKFTEEFMKREETEGICPHCYHHLMPITDSFERDNKYEAMKRKILVYKPQTVWIEIEYLKDHLERREYRMIFFQVLKDLKITFDP